MTKLVNPNTIPNIPMVTNTESDICPVTITGISTIKATTICTTPLTVNIIDAGKAALLE
eukprot:CAMPEP_0114985628 /NCGR_PEP_ID=MMETSP0216-20121206/7971_1 /TAXON_ID=223996 /ORGANISM="Protocruzia adherens, Strain Boccale" /LENGTH=58 /DNA_ID=CAMNT_0002347963 /DNA_START=295 /DNA_END=471 /DNA_ORIENTATION=-